MSQPTFSICHATARPDTTGGEVYRVGEPWMSHGWAAACITWFRNCADPEALEYVLCVDHDGEFPAEFDVQGIRVVRNRGRKCCVDGFNAAAQASTGKVLILASDDVFPPPLWDAELLKVLPDLEREWVVEVSTGGGADQARIITLQILTRARYERLGYAFWPDYESMSADIDFTETARRDGIVIDARHLLFRHMHPSTGGAVNDAVYAHENRREAYATGDRILAERRAAGFLPVRKEGFPK